MPRWCFYTETRWTVSDNGTIVHTLKDVALVLKVHPETLRGWVRKGMPRKKIAISGRKRFEYDVKKIKEWATVRMTGNQGGMEPVMSDKQLEAVKRNVEKFKGAIDFYKVNRADIFVSKQMKYQDLADRILETMTPEEISAAKLTEKLAALKVLDTGAAIFYDKERLERGESTQNVSVLVGAIKALKRKRSGQLTE